MSKLVQITAWIITGTLTVMALYLTNSAWCLWALCIPALTVTTDINVTGSKKDESKDKTH